MTSGDRLPSISYDDGHRSGSGIENDAYNYGTLLLLAPAGNTVTVNLAQGENYLRRQ